MEPAANGNGSSESLSLTELDVMLEKYFPSKPEPVGILALSRTVSKKSSGEKRASEGDALTFSRQSLKEATEGLAFVGESGSLRQRLRKGSSPEGIKADTVPLEIFTLSHPPSSPVRLSRSKELGKGRSSAQDLIGLAVKEQAEKEVDLSDSPILSRKPSSIALKFKKSLNRQEAELMKKEFDNKFMEVFNLHGHLNPHERVEKEQNNIAWVNKIKALRDIYFGIHTDVDLRVARLARASLLKTYLEKVKPDAGVVENMILEFYRNTLMHHRSVETAIQNLMKGMMRLSIAESEVLETTIILNAPAPHLAQLLFKRLKQIRHLKLEEDAEKKARTQFFTNFGTILAKREKTEPILELFGIIFENDINREMKKYSTIEEVMTNLFRDGWHPSIALLEAYERARFPQVLNDLIKGFKDCYVDLVNKHGGIFRLFSKGKHASEIKTEEFFNAFEVTVNKLCDLPMNPELAAILQLFRRKIEATFPNNKSQFSLTIVTTIFILYLLGHAVGSQKSVYKSKKAEANFATDIRVLYEFTKWLTKCIEFIFDPNERQKNKKSGDPSNEFTRSRFSISKEKFQDYMNQATASPPSRRKEEKKSSPPQGKRSLDKK